MELPPDKVEYLTGLAEQLSSSESFHGLRYFRSVVSGPGVSDVFEPDVAFRPTLIAGYWPGGFLGGASYTAAQVQKEPLSDLEIDEQRLFLQQLIRGSSIGAVALKQHDQYTKTAPEAMAFQKGLGQFAVQTMLDICEMRKVPFSYLITGPVERSSIIPVGERVARIYYPGGVSPQQALAMLWFSVIHRGESKIP